MNAPASEQRSLQGRGREGPTHARVFSHDAARLRTVECSYVFFGELLGRRARF